MDKTILYEQNYTLNNQKRLESIWDHPCYNEIKAHYNQYYAFLEDPNSHHRHQSSAATAAESTSVFTCRRCSSTRILSTSKQIRRADEEATVYLECLQCNLRWRL